MGILTEYIQAALHEAKYELMENGRYFASFPSLRGCWAEGATIEVCREELISTLESWILLKLSRQDEMPIIRGVDINLSKFPVSLDAA